MQFHLKGLAVNNPINAITLNGSMRAFPENTPIDHVKSMSIVAINRNNLNTPLNISLTIICFPLLKIYEKKIHIKSIEFC